MAGFVFHVLAGAPEPVAPYSHAVEVDGWIFCAGQIASDLLYDPATIPEGIEAQTRLVMENLARVLEGVGAGLDQVVSARVFLTDFARDYRRMDAVYRTFFAPGRLPARTCVGVTALAGEALVEIDAIAKKPWSVIPL